jgi:hypothetical protein
MIQNQHLTDLERALGQLREQRRNWVRTLAAGAGHERGKTESAIESFLKCQTAIGPPLWVTTAMPLSY